EPTGPELPVRFQPGDNLGERCNIEPVPAPLCILAHSDQPGLTQHPEVPGDTGLAEVEGSYQLPDGALALTQHIEDLSSRRFGKNLKGRRHSVLYNRSDI